MKVALFSNTYWPTVNGVAVSVANLRDGLVELGHEADIFAPAPPGFDRSEDQPGVYRFPSLMPPRWLTKQRYPIALPWSGEVWTRLSQCDYDLVHTHHPWHVGQWAQWYAGWKDLPLVSTVHTQYELYAKEICFPDLLLEWWIRRKLKKHIRQATVVTTPGRGSMVRLDKLCNTAKLLEVSNATKLERFWSANGDQVRGQFGVLPGEVLLGYVGRVTPEKNIGVLLDGFMRVLSSASQVVKLMIVGGDASDLTQIRQYASRLGIPEDRLILTGRVPYNDVHLYYAAMDMFVTASYSEVQPMTFAEALGCSLPIVAFDVPGCNDMVEDGNNGMLVGLEQGSLGLAYAILKLLNNQQERVAMRSRAQRWSKRYDASAAIPRMLDAYELARILYLGHGKHAA